MANPSDLVIRTTGNYMDSRILDQLKLMERFMGKTNEDGVTIVSTARMRMAMLLDVRSR